jgi:outer membrane receptor protein involved in Fe transport
MRSFGQRIWTLTFTLAAAALLAYSCIPSVAHAQTSQGAVSGTVRDATGAVVPGAMVVLKNEATGQARETTTTEDGTFRADAVQPGPYTVQVSKSGFNTSEIQHLQVNPTVITSYDVRLSVATATIEVVVQAATAATLDLDSGGLAANIPTQVLNTVPVFSLNPVELAITLPGVQLVNNGGEGNGYEMSVNGARSRANNFLIDGQDDNDNAIAGQALQAQIPDMFSSVTVLTNSYSAEYGRAGGAVVNMVTKSGTNTPHGQAWDLYSGSGLNAIDGLARGTGISKTRYDQHQYGFLIGGPIVRNKLLAFGGSQWSRYYGSATPDNFSLPTDQDTVHLDNNATSNSYAYLKTLAATNPQAALLMKYIGSLSQYQYVGTSSTSVSLINEPSCTSCTLHFVTYRRPSEASQQTDTQWTTKVDYQATAKDHLSGRFIHDYNFLSPDWFNFASQLPGFDAYQGGPAEQAGFDYTHLFSPTVLNEFRASMTRINFLFDSLPATIANPLYKSPVINVANTDLPQLGPQSTVLPQGRGHNFYQFQDTVTDTFGRNTLRAGADVGRVLVRDFVPFNNFGDLAYNESEGYSAFNNYLDDYLGSSGTASISFGGNRVDSHQWATAFFVQDDIKFTPDFTANLGLRYEFQTNPENAVKYPAINPATVFTDPIETVHKVKEDRNNFGPRVGFAWNPHLSTPYLADGQTVYHAGFGIFYDVLFTNITDNTQENAPNVQSPQVQIADGRGAPNSSSIIASMQPAPTISPFNTVFSTVDNLVNPVTYQWTLGIERQIMGNVKMTVNYVGTKGSKLFVNQQYNYLVNGVRVDRNRGPITARGNFAASSYNGLQAGVTHGFRHGLFVQASYTYSKNLDNGSEVFTNFSSPTSYSANLAPGYRYKEWGPSAYDFRQYLSLAYAWSIPNIPQLSNAGANELVDIAARGWQFSGTSAFQTGQYSTFNLSGFDVNRDGSSANDRPIMSNSKAGLEAIGIDGREAGYLDANGNFVPCNPKVGQGYVDLGANNATGACNPVTPDQVHWLIPYPYTAANVAQEIGRNSFENPGFWNMNWALQKSFNLHIPRLENSSFVFRGEAENVFNHNNVGPLLIDLLYATPGPGDPYMNRNSARFDDNRALRIWAKFVF